MFLVVLVGFVVLLAGEAGAGRTVVSNDDFDAATPILALPFSDSVDTRTATRAADDPFSYNAGPGPTVWYHFVASTNIRLVATTCGSDYYTGISVYSGSRGSLTQVAGNNGASGSCPGQTARSQVVFDAAAGETLSIMIGSGFFAPLSGSLVFSVRQAPPPPANDEIGQATPIASLPFTDTVDTMGATRVAGDPLCLGKGSTVWYRFAPTVSTAVVADTRDSNYSTVLSVFTGAPGSLTPVDCDPSGSNRNQEEVSFNALAGRTYYLLVESWKSFFTTGGGDAVLNVRGNPLPPPPPNDDIANATAMSSLPFFDSRDIRGATTEAGDGDCGGNRHTAWYSFTATASKPMETTTFGSNFDASLAVYSGSPGALTLVGCDTQAFHFQPVVFFDAVAGQTYYVRVASAFRQAAGTVTFAFRDRLSFPYTFTGPARITGSPGQTKRFRVVARIGLDGIVPGEAAVVTNWGIAAACGGCRIAEVSRGGMEQFPADFEITELTVGAGNEGAISSVSPSGPLVGPGPHNVLALTIEATLPDPAGCVNARVFNPAEGRVSTTLVGNPRFPFTQLNSVRYHDEEESRPAGLGELTVQLCGLTPRSVSIDIKPGTSDNSINLKSNGRLPVAILSTPTFDARTVDPATVTLAAAAPSSSTAEDVNKDRLPDLLLRFDTQALQLRVGDTVAVLDGEQFDGTPVRGSDVVRVVHT